MSQAQNQKFKIKQFQWFQMQTKVRQIIQQVLGPLQKRILQNSSILNKIKFNQTQDEKKIQQICLMIANDPKIFQTGIFLTIDNKFQQQSKKIQQLSRQIIQQNKYVDQKFKILDVRMQQSSQVLQNVAAMRQRVAKQMQLQNQNINSIRINIQKMIQDLNSDIKISREISQKNLENCQKADYKLGQKISQIDLIITAMQQTLKSHHQLHRQQGCRLQAHHQNLKKHNQDIQTLQQSKAMTKRLSQYIIQLQNQIKKFDFKLTTLSPLITQSQISDCLYNVLPQKMKKRIAIHQHKKYFKLNRQVLQKQYTKISQKFHGLQLMQQMQKRNTRQIVQMKRKKLLSMGVDIDHLTYQQRQRYYNDMVLDDVIDDDDDQVRVTAKVDQKDVVSIMDKYFKSFTNKVNQKIAIQLQDSKKYLIGVQQQIRHQLLQSFKKFKQLQQICDTFQINQLLENKQMASQFKKTQKSIENIINQCENIKNLQKSIYNFCSLVNHLQIQDQIDKQNISLMGLQQNSADNIPSSKNSLVQLDKKCFSCCGYPATTISAFKMACLAYSPSMIVIDNNQYKRQQLLQFTTSVLQGIKKSLQGNQQIQGNNQDLSDIIVGNNQINQQNFNVEIQKDKRIGTSGNKFRRTKKLSISNNKHHTKTTLKNTSLRQDMLNVSYAFTQLRKRNLNFLI